MAKKKNSGKKEHDEFFVAVSNPKSIRLSFLQARKTVLESMKVFQELKDIRKEKIDQKKQLKKQERKISSLLSKIKTQLPYVKVGSLPLKPEISDVKASEEQKAKPEPKPEPKTEVDRIEVELGDIEKQLAELG
jgi:small-conductance mechanosensitive channel